VCFWALHVKAPEFLAAMDGRLPDALSVEVEFKSPLLLPSTVGFAARSQGSGWTLAVFHPPTGLPHLTGSIQ
jgi:hypothetical protein